VTINTSTRLTPEEAATLVRQAATGDQNAWQALVAGYNSLLMASIRGFRLCDSDVTDVAQTAWLRLVQHIDRIDEPERVGAWLTTTARREALRILKHRNRVVSTEASCLDLVDEVQPDVSTRITKQECSTTVTLLLSELKPRDRKLLELLMSDPAPSYEEISVTMSMPIGSIGPTRSRCLQRLSAIADRRGIALRELASA
jgi:RNA polymerase sigma factor (sigma-70 family)